MKISKNVILANYTTFHTGGRALFFAEVKNISELKEAVAFSKKNKLKIFVLGGGSNILLPDRDIKGLVIKMNFRGMVFKDNTVFAGAGEIWDKLVAKTITKDLGGIENLSLIPGTVGGAVYQNIGAYGTELKNVLQSVKAFDIKSGLVRELSRNECEFGYRDSIFQKAKGRPFIILEAKLRLEEKPVPKIFYPDLIKYFSDKKEVSIQDMRKAIIKIRKSKLVYPTPEVGTAGSFFKNPTVTLKKYKKILTKNPYIKGRQTGDDAVKLSAGQLIEYTGWKGKRLKDAGVSSKHALVLVTYKYGRSKDVLRLVGLVKKSVENKFGIKLEPEVKIII